MLVPVDELAPDPANARVHTSRSDKALAFSLQKFGQQKPIVVDAAGTVLAGNGTLARARALGWTHIAVVRSDLVERRDKIAFAIADNRTAELSGWNGLLLESQLDDLGDEGFEVAELEFSEDEMAEILSAEEIALAATEPDGGDRATKKQKPKSQFAVVIECKSEAEQTQLLDRMTAEGWDAKAIFG